MDDIRNSQGARNAEAVYQTLMQISVSARTLQNHAVAMAKEIDFIRVRLGKQGASVADRAAYRRHKRIFKWWGTIEASVLANVAPQNLNAVALAAMQVIYLRRAQDSAADCFGVTLYQLKNYLALLRTAGRFATDAHNQRSKVGQVTQRR